MSALTTANFNHLMSAVNNSGGYKRDITNLMAFTSTGLVLSGGTNPRRAVLDDELEFVAWANAQVGVALIPIVIPGDYSSVDDVLLFRFIASTDGVTDSPTIGFSAFGANPGSAADLLKPIAPSAPINGPNRAEYEVSLSGNALKPGATITLSVTPSAHPNDIIALSGAVVRYKSVTALSDSRQR